MEAIVQIMDAEKLLPVMDIPENLLNNKVQVVIIPFPEYQEKSEETERRITLKKIEEFRKKYNRETFTEHLKKKLEEGVVFEFDAHKIIDGTETEDEKQQRYRMEKRAWSDSVDERVKRGES